MRRTLIVSAVLVAIVSSGYADQDTGSLFSKSGRDSIAAKQQAQVKYWVSYMERELDADNPITYTKSSGGVFKFWHRKRLVKNEARRLFWESQGESYSQPWPDLNDPNSKPLPRAPRKFYRGILDNNFEGRDARFVISGRGYSVTKTVPAAGKKVMIDGQEVIATGMQWALLPAGRYYVEVYRMGDNWPWHYYRLDINTGEGDNEVEGYICDFSIITK